MLFLGVLFFVPGLFLSNWIVTFIFALAGGPGTTNSLEVNADFTAAFQLVNADSILISRQY